MKELEQDHSYQVSNQNDNVMRNGITYIGHENYDIATAMSSSHADSVLGHCPGWGYLNI